MVEFVQGFYLFKGHPAKSGVWSADDDRLAQMIEVLGPFPESLLKRGTRVAKYFDEKGIPTRNLHKFPTPSYYI